MSAPSRIVAMLGPTNTGKTHMAVERMLSYETGIIGLPLRLLAREVFDKVRARVGRGAVALITGEERIVPEGARYFVCTVEAMPLSRPVEFVAVDEVQLAADLERGHVFTDRILHARGQLETWLLGAETMRERLRDLLPDVQFRSRPRFSRLTYAGQKKLTRLPPRTAIVAFSAEQVYAIAELIRRQKGGAAVVMGALSPRTRNAQVALYQSGEVDYLVATDAIGMGLNMDVDHVAFAATRKFDGFRHRALTTAELGQIAGRAGRHLNDGTFGVTARAEPFDEDTIEALEEHRFPPVRLLQWRNRALDFSSIDRLLASLMALPKRPGLARAPMAADVAALELLSRQEEVRRLADTPARLKLLWEVCQLPDYRNITGGEHAGLIASIFTQLVHEGRIDEDWLARQVARCARFDGDIDTLSMRIAHIRTWTFVSHRGHWLRDAAHWQERTRQIEDALSDALHERLTKRFIDRKTSVLLRRLREKEELMSSVDDEGAVRVEDSYVGRMEGLRFIADGEQGEGAHKKAWDAATRKAVARELSERAQAISAAPDTDFTLDPSGYIIWHGAPIARLQPGPELLRPDVRLLADDGLEGPEREAVRFRLQKFLSRHIEALLAPLIGLREDEALTGITRGLAWRLVENLGVLPRAEVAEEVKSLDQDERAKLRKHGVRFGAWHLFIPALLKPAPTALRLLLWALQEEKAGRLNLDALPQPPGQGLTSVVRDESWPEGFARVCGYMECGPRAVRVDMIERLGDLIRERVFWKPRFTGEERPEGSVEGGGFTVIPDMMSLVGCSGEDFAAILRTMGYRAERRPAPKPPAAEAQAGNAPPNEAEAPGQEPGQEPEQGADQVPAQAHEAHEEQAGQAASDTGAAVSDEPVAESAEGPAASDAGQPVTADAAQQGAPGQEAVSEPAMTGAAEGAKTASAEDEVLEKRAVSESAVVDAEIAALAAAEAPAEPEFIEVWWPDGTGPFRKKPKRRTKPRPEGTGRDQGKAAGRSRKPGRGKKSAAAAASRGAPGPRQRKRKDKPVDPDSPFAVLQKLKSELEKKP